MQQEIPSFGKQLKKIRERAGFSQEELAERAGLTAKAISALERGERKRPYPNTIRALADALGLSEDERGAWTASLTPRGAASDASVTVIRLPAPLSELLGREEDVAAVRQFLEAEGTRLLTLTGPGGVGKTRLALQIASQTRFPDGAAFVALDAVPAPALVLSAIVHALGLQEMGTLPDRELLCHYLQTKQMVLVLDNFEHVLDAASEISLLLAACPGLVILVTSRAPMRLRGEQEYPLAPLAVPSLDCVLPVEEVQASPAVKLFVQRAQAVNPNFTLTQANAVTITAICRRLDGLPLALELAAARLKLLTPTALLKRLDQTLPLLVGGARDLPERQQTMRQTIAWSYHLLTPNEQRAFRRLAVFAGTWTLDAAEAVCGVNPFAGQVLDRIASLIDKSLVQRAEWGGEDGRFLLLKTIRAYALEQLQEAGEEDAIQAAHLDWCSALAQEGGEQANGPDQVIWLTKLEQDLPNLRAALEWAFTTPHATEGRIAKGLKIVSELYRFWQGRGYLSEGRMWLERGLSHSVPVSAPSRAQALNNLAWLMHQQGETHRAITIQQESLALYRELQDEVGVSFALDGLGDAAWAQGDFDFAVTAYQESLEIRRLHGNAHQIALSLYSLGRLHLDRNALEQAEPILNEAFTLLTRLNDHRGVALVQHALGRLALKRGHWTEVTEHTQKALVTFWELVNKVDIAECLEIFALVAQAKGQGKEAVRLWAVAANLRETLGVPIRSYDEEALKPLRERLSEAQFAAAWQKGCNQPLETAIATLLDHSSL